MMDGLLIIDKPAGITSHDVVARVRRILRTKRVGHTGTLDPFATGVMVILVGQATRLAQYLDRDEKEYEAVARFGWETDTGDKTGQRTTDPGPEIADEDLSAIDWDVALERFRGDILQVPPMYSAKKIEGKRLYELARKGQEVERKAVPVSIYGLELLGVAGPEASFRVVCSAGTYIRTLAEDIGRALGRGAHLSELRRTRAGIFDISRAVTLEELGSLPSPLSALIPMAAAVAHLPAITLDPDRAGKTKNGLSSRTAEAFTDGAVVRMIDTDGGLVAIGQYREAEKIVQPKVVFG